MSLASASSSVAAPPPGRASVSRRRGARARAIAMAARPPACAAGLRGGDGDGAGAGAGLGAVEGLRAPSARLLGARCRRGGGGVCGRRVAVVRAATLEERIASGEFTKPRTSIGETVLNAMRSVLKNVELPQSEYTLQLCADLLCSLPHSGWPPYLPVLSVVLVGRGPLCPRK